MTVLLLAAMVIAAPLPKDARKDPLRALEEKLHGSWEGGACVGTFSFKADGTYDRLDDQGSLPERRGRLAVPIA